MSSIAEAPLFAVWYNWIVPLWLVGVGMFIATAAALTLYLLLKLVAPKVAAIARVTAHEKQNAEYRERSEREKVEEARKADQRIGELKAAINRIEDCFIVRKCGVQK